MSDDKKSFTVSDRRHFTAEGRARETEPAFEGTPATPAPPPVDAGPERARETRQAVADSSPAGIDVSDREPDDVDEALGADGEEDLPPFPADLLGLIGSLATQATVLLAGDPATRRPPARVRATKAILSS